MRIVAQLGTCPSCRPAPIGSRNSTRTHHARMRRGLLAKLLLHISEVSSTFHWNLLVEELGGRRVNLPLRRTALPAIALYPLFYHGRAMQPVKGKV